MKTKYMKIKASERLPKPLTDVVVLYKNEEGTYSSETGFISENGYWWVYDSGCTNPEFWLEEVPDNEEDLLFIVNGFDNILLKLSWPDEITEEIMQYRAYYNDLQYRINENNKAD
ncbi:hypothetical protein [Elizabethkingia miricola]|uniref:hypothetical protein n=1 Tax=Elizabethkingia miricola TaxID=172045 RepID=UPI00099AEB9A|nr:hypothetical protein [Elizabethkingia miricola]OPC34582.1 hypothetical protein BAX99_06865 [Elizabethkingia miricola]